MGDESDKKFCSRHLDYVFLIIVSRPMPQPNGQWKLTVYDV